MVKDISVITCTNRYGGIDINWSSLRRQTFENFEWILCDSLYEERKEAVKEYTKNDPRVKHMKQSSKDPKAKTWLNHAENEGIRASAGELIVFLQDYIHIDPHGLEQFWIAYKENNKRMITGVGHQYGKPGKQDIVNSKGLITIFDKPFTGIPETIVWADPRMRTGQGTFTRCIPNDIEFNYCAIPRQALFDIGGCDESYDYIGHAWDNVSVAIRASLLGFEPFIDQANESKSIRHDDFFDTKIKDHDFKHILDFHNKRMGEIQRGIRSPIYHYL